MRHECQVYRDYLQCHEPAVDYVEITATIPPETVRVWMCAQHWDEHQKNKKEPNA
jgi:hypothetical protein